MCMITNKENITYDDNTHSQTICMKTHECKITCTRLELLSDGTLLRGIELCEHNLGFLLGQDACSLGVLRGQG